MSSDVVIDNIIDNKSLKDMTFIYVVSNHIYSSKNLYKIGKHTGTKKMLIQRYKTYLMEPIVYFYFPSGDISHDETSLLKRFSKYRVGTSEFVEIHIDKLLDNIYMYYRIKYERTPTVKIPYHLCYYQSQIYDMYEKKIKGKQCSMLCHSLHNSYRNIEFKIDNQIIYDLNITEIYPYLDKFEYSKDFFNCLFLDYTKRDSILFLDRFIENGWNVFLKNYIKEFYGYESYKELSRKDIIQKEKFHERLILVKYSDVPLELVLEKIRWTKTCFIIEDENIYSLDNSDVRDNVKLLDLFYYLFYFL